jgi:outer membrane murein-binding lipoprotein Lpp
MKEEIMNILFKSLKTLAFSSQVRYSVLIIVFVLLAMAGCQQDNTADLKAKIATLESQVQAQERKIEMLANAMTISRASVFDSPLQRFFDEANFWDVIYVDKGNCYKECYAAYNSSMRKAEEEKDPDEREKEEGKAFDERIKCRNDCRPPFQ